MSGGKEIGLEEGWAKIKAGIDRLEKALKDGVLTAGASHTVFKQSDTMLIYHCIYRMATQRTPNNFAAPLYERHGESIRKFLRDHTLQQIRAKRGEQLLAKLVEQWELHGVMNKWLYKMFQYLDRYYVDHHNLPSLREAGLQAFKREVFEPVKGEVTRALIELINRERNGEGGVDRSLIKRVVEIYVAVGGGDVTKNETLLDCYLDDFQRPLIEASTAYYREKAASWIETENVPSYLQKCEEVLVAEANRVAAFLIQVTESPLLRAVENTLLVAQQARLLENETSGLRVMLRDDRREDLARLFRLYERVQSTHAAAMAGIGGSSSSTSSSSVPATDGLTPIAKTVREYFQTHGLEIVREREAAASGEAPAAAGAGVGAGGAAGGAGSKPAKEDPNDPTFVQSLIDLHERAKSIVNSEFKGNSLFQKALKDAFEVFVNKETTSSGSKFSNAEMIASYLNRVLTAGNDKLSDAQIEDSLDKAVQLFSYVSDKDVFGDIYRTQLAKRLLNQRSISQDIERSNILKLKLRCGAQYTSKMEGMLNDLQSAETQSQAFKTHAGELAATAGLPKGMDFNVQVLTTGFWPSFPKVDLALPSNFAACASVFTSYYQEKTNHRKLTWVHSLGTCTVRGNYGKTDGGKENCYDFQLTTIQATCLMLFNDKEGALTLDEVKDAMGTDIEVAKRALHSLSCGKYKLLLKSPESNSIGANDSFRYNAKFSCPLRKVRVPMASLEELGANKKNIDEDRSLAIEAAIVRIMKARKTLAHAQLVTECIAQLHFFKPQAKDIKKRIEHLIQRDYLERDDADSNIYNYLA